MVENEVNIFNLSDSGKEPGVGRHADDSDAAYFVDPDECMDVVESSPPAEEKQRKERVTFFTKLTVGQDVHVSLKGLYHQQFKAKSAMNKSTLELLNTQSLTQQLSIKGRNSSTATAKKPSPTFRSSLQSLHCLLHQKLTMITCHLLICGII